jgi:hypothetical protein
MTSPALSLIVPNHNHTDKLPRLFDSILAQSFKNLEVILVDDCSDEPCGPVVEAWRDKGLSISLLEHTQRIYTMQARLAGIRAAKADIIGFADADDSLWGTEALERHIALFQEHKADMLHFRAVTVDSQGNFTATAPLCDPFASFLQGDAILSTYLDAHVLGASSLWNKLFARPLCLKVAETAQHSRVLRYVEDVYLLLRCCFYAKAYVGSELTGYAHAYTDKSATEAAERAVQICRSLEEQVVWFMEQGADDATVNRVAAFLHKLLCRYAGRMSLNACQKEPRCISDAAVEELLLLSDAKTLLKVLLMGNGKNAERVLAIHKTMNNL